MEERFRMKLYGDKTTTAGPLSRELRILLIEKTIPD